LYGDKGNKSKFFDEDFIKSLDVSYS